MRFWDTSALVPLLQLEKGTAPAERWFSQDPELVVWALTSTEALSAIERCRRLGVTTDEEAERSRQLLKQVWATARVVADVESAQRRAARLLRIHPLRAADALQLGAALVWAEGEPERLVFHTFDDRLAEAARKEGFTVPP